MQFITIYHSLNQSYNVEKQVIEQVVKKAFDETKNIKLDNVEVDFFSNSANSISLRSFALIDKNAKYQDVITNVYNKIEQYIENIVNTKAKNIRIIIKGNY